MKQWVRRCLHRLTASIGSLAVAGCAAAAAASPDWPMPEPQTVQVASLDRPGGTPLLLPGWWFAAPAADLGAPAGRPALVLLHGCSGVFGRAPRLAARYTEMASRLAALGVQALVVDSLTPRGERELCTQRVGERRTTQQQRRRDALGAVQWLADQPGVDRTRIGLLGWSNGGSTVLSASNLAHPEVARAAVKPSLAVAYYPGCATERERGYEPAAPLLLLLGQADDWTPAAPCKELASAARGEPRPQWVAYEGAHHGFDGTAAVRLRADVPNGATEQSGVHVGGQPLARALAVQRLQAFLHEQWKLPLPAAPVAVPGPLPPTANPATTEHHPSRTGT
jgi:dienelactone hydrolase